MIIDVLKIVAPMGAAVFIFLKKREIAYLVSTFSQDRSEVESDPVKISDKLDMILRDYNE